MPPAFNLSQDQTLKFNLCCRSFDQRRTHSELKKKMFFVFTSNLSTQFSKFSRSSKASLSLSLQPDTHAYRFVDQFLKNISLLFRADEFENYKTQIRFVKCFWKFIFNFLFTWLLVLSLKQGVESYTRFFPLSRATWWNFYQPLDLDFCSLRSNGLRILTLFLALSRHFFNIFLR